MNNTNRFKKQHTIFIVIIGLVILLDQIGKWIIVRNLSLHETLEVIPGFFSLTYIRNTGGAFGILAGRVSFTRTIFFLVITCTALGVLFYHLYFKLSPNRNVIAISISLIIGGAIGNLIDRIRFGEVIDFLDFYIGSFHWPAFNVADSAVSAGVAIYCLQLLKRGNP
nr:signal peptidase II [Desulfobacterales bacterium]